MFSNVKTLLKKNKYTYSIALTAYNAFKKAKARWRSNLGSVKILNIFTDPSISIYIDTKGLFANEFRRKAFNRMDTVVRYMAIEEFYGKNENGFRLYEKMQHARCSNPDGRLDNFKELLESIQANGFDDDGHPPIKVNQSLTLLDGSHRFALALYHGIKKIPIMIEPTNQKVNYSLDWFTKVGFTEQETQLMRDALKRIQMRNGLFFIAIIWPPAHEHFNEISNALGQDNEILWQKDLTFCNENDFVAFAKGSYAIDDIAGWKVQKKLDHMQNCERRIRILALNIINPDFRAKSLNNQPISRRVEAIKKTTRNDYAPKIDNYFYDIILHIGDNYRHTDHLLRFLRATEKDIDLRAFFASIENMRYALIKSEAPYIPEDFPLNYPLNKDIDILCDEDEYPAMCALALNFSNKYIPQYDIRIISESNKYRIRFEVNRFLCFQIDVSRRLEGFNDSFINNLISRRVTVNKPLKYYVASDLDEMYIRLFEYTSYPTKQHHYDYLLRRKQLVGMLDLIEINNADLKNKMEAIAEMVRRED